jgi:hypothetical protein
MQKVISINLNGNAFQFEEDGYDALRDYLARADRSSKTIGSGRDRRSRANDRRQVPAVSWTEQAIVTGGGRAVVAEMGPVTSGPEVRRPAKPARSRTCHLRTGPPKRPTDA